jgi:hypothetical protein
MRTHATNSAADAGLSPGESVTGPGTADSDDFSRWPAWALAALAAVAGLTIAAALVFGLTGWPDTGGGMLSAVRIGGAPSGVIPAIPAGQSVTTRSLEQGGGTTLETSAEAQVGAGTDTAPVTGQASQPAAAQGDPPGGSDPGQRLVVPGALRIEDDGEPSEPSDVEAEDADPKDAPDLSEDESEPTGDPVEDDSAEDDSGGESSPSR